MRALVTGVTGFVGPYLVDELVNSGYEVFGLDRAGKDVKNCRVFECDILDKEKLFSIISEVSPDAVFHLAGQSSVPKSFEIPELTMEINVGGTRNLLDAVVKAKIMPKVLVVSSSQVYGKSNKEVLNESSPLRPESPYAESRVKQEEAAFGYFKKHKLPIIVSRSFNHTGPGQPPDFVCPDFARQIVKIERGEKEPVIFVGNTSSRIDFSDVRDVVKAYVLLAEKGEAGEIYHVCSGKGHSIKQVLGLLCSMSDAAISIKKDPKKFRKQDIMVGDNSRIRQLGWQSRIGFEQTLKDIIDYWRAQ